MALETKEKVVFIDGSSVGAGASDFVDTSINSGNMMLTVSGTLAGTVTLEVLGGGGWVAMDGGVFDTVGQKAIVGINSTESMRVNLSSENNGLWVELTL